MKLVTCHSLNAVLEATEALQQGMPKTIHWFRGTPNEAYSLQTTLDRPGRELLRKREPRMLDVFLERAGRMRGGDQPQFNYHRRLVVARHYRLPCRLMDWTESVLIALYFATEPVADRDHGDSNGAIWVLRPQLLNQVEGPPVDRTDLVFGPDIPLLNEHHHHLGSLVKDAFEAVPTRDKRIIGVRAVAFYDRMVVQQSAFTIHGRAEPLDTHGSAGQLLEKWIVPNEKKGEIRMSLRSIGISERTVFPDLEHLARDLVDEFLIRGDHGI